MERASVARLSGSPDCIRRTVHVPGHSDDRGLDREARDLAGSRVIAGQNVFRRLSRPVQIVRLSTDDRRTRRTPDGRAVYGVVSDLMMPSRVLCPATTLSAMEASETLCAMVVASSTALELRTR